MIRDALSAAYPDMYLSISSAVQPEFREYERGTTASVYNSTPAVSDLSLLTVGKHVKVIGAWRPGTNEIDIATIYASN